MRNTRTARSQVPPRPSRQMVTLWGSAVSVMNTRMACPAVTKKLG